jgi:hypothetical protein
MVIDNDQSRSAFCLAERVLRRLLQRHSLAARPESIEYRIAKSGTPTGDYLFLLGPDSGGYNKSPPFPGRLGRTQKRACLLELTLRCMNPCQSRQAPSLM